MRTRREENAPDDPRGERRPPVAPDVDPQLDALLRLQGTAGNQAVDRLLQRTRSEHHGGRRGARDRTRERGRRRDAKYAPDTGEGMPEAPEGFEAEQDDGARYAATYEAALREFADSTDEMDFSGSGTEPRFDAEYWKCTIIVTTKAGERKTLTNLAKALEQWKNIVETSDEVELEYTLKPGVSPSLAIRQIVARPEEWAMDCIDYVVAARLYAECLAAGDEAFDAKYTNVGTAVAPAPMRMAQHNTPKLTSSDFWRRRAQGAEFISHTTHAPTGVMPAGAAEEDEFLRTVPIGARVMWTTRHRRANEDMENENTIKVGEDLYAAHPLGTISGAKVRDELVVDVDRRGRDVAMTKEDRAAHVARYIYLCEVEWYDRGG